MKRSTALLLALATLIAHALTLAEDASGRIGPPDDRAWVAFRMGRHAVQGLGPVWNPGAPLDDIYPSWAWVGMAWLSELLHIPPQHASQVIGIASAAACLFLVSRFSPDRLAGVIAPMLLVFSGTLATASTRGTELCTFAAVLCGSLLALETGRRRALAVFLLVLPLLRDEGILCVLALAALALASRLKPRRSEEPLPPQARISPFVFGLPLIVFATMAGLRHAATGEWLSTTTRGLLAGSEAQWSDGWLYLREYFLRSGAPLLIVFPLAFLLLGRTSPRGRRALALGLFWCALLVLQGGDTLPFHSSLAPAVPLLYVAIQEALIEGVDSRSLRIRGLAWSLFLLGVLSSTLASRLPANLGPIPLQPLTERWIYPKDDPFEARFGLPPARLGVARAIERDTRLRSVGLVARESFPPGTHIASPWPGVIGYLSGQTVRDWFDRVTPDPSSLLPRPWSGRPSAELAHLFESQPEVVVTTELFGNRPPIGGIVVQRWIDEFERHREESLHAGRIGAAVRAFELISVPIPIDTPSLQPFSADPLYLLRLRKEGLLPEVDLKVFGGRYFARAKHHGSPQLVDLEITGTDIHGNLWSLLPTGRFLEGSGVHARAGLLLKPIGDREVRLIEGDLPAEPQLVELQAVLRNPGSQKEELFSTASRRSIAKVLPTKR